MTELLIFAIGVGLGYIIKHRQTWRNAYLTGHEVNEKLHGVDDKKWISVNKRLPSKNDNEQGFGEFLTYNPKSVFCKYASVAWHGDRWATSNGYITHWMPLPEPPEVK